MNTEKLTWYVARSGGIVAWCLLALGIILGLVLSSRVLGRQVSPAWTLSVHRYLGGLSVVFTAVHVVAIMLDDFVDFGLQAVLVPWASSWRPGAVAWGIVAMYLMLAIELTSFAMRRLPKRLWRAVHWTSAPLFVTATIHGYQAGTDVGRAFVMGTVGVIAILVALTAVRVVRARRDDTRQDPRDLLDRAKGRPEMRPEPPPHVLDGLTLETKPLVPGRRASVGVGPEPGGTDARREDQRVGATVVSDRPTSLEEALPPVPDAPGFGEELVAAAAGPGAAAGETFLDALTALPDAVPVPVAAAPTASPAKHRVAPAAAAQAPPTPPAPAGAARAPRPHATPPPPHAPPRQPPSTAPGATTMPRSPSEGTAPFPPPPRPAWGDVAPDADRRPGPAPGVWKRPAPPPSG